MLIGAGMTGGCSVEKNTGATRAFHQLVSHYNIYFNAKESYKAGIRQAWKQYKPDLNRTLPVFPLENEQTAGLMTSQMDRVVKKTSKLITYHSITAKPKKNPHPSPKEKAFYKLPEYNKWVDDSYLLMGKAQYLKNDLESAAITFNYIIRRYPDKKVVTEARIWLMKTYDRQGNLRNAEMVLAELQKQEKEEGIPEALLQEYHAAVANHYLLQGKQEAAITELEKAYGFSRKKRDKAHLAYLLGQLYEEKEDGQKAVEYFQKVLHNNPVYDMRFSAQVKIAQNSGLANADIKEIKKTLRKLLRDEKNKEYRDQIYYAFGKVSLREGKEDEALDYFLKSAHASVSNNTQKGLSYLTLAGLYFGHEDYKHAQIYYDSAVTFLPGDYPGFEGYRSKSKSLNRLVRYTDEVALQDSLQRLARMSREERLAVIDEIIRKEEEKERRAAEANKVEPYSQGRALDTRQRYLGEIARGGKWYFYNPTALAFGREEFLKRWGKRPLEDNWRRRNKVTMSFETASQDSVTLIPSDQARSTSNRKSRSYYLRQIPLNDSLMALSHAKRQEGLFESSLIFEEEMHDHQRALRNLETLVKDYPNGEYTLPAYYNLYKIYKETGQTALADKYKAMLIARFPESEQAKILKDPEYYKKVNEKRKEAEERYAQVYDLFERGEYAKVIAAADAALKDSLDPYLRDRYLFLRALAMGKSSDPKVLKDQLEWVADTVQDAQIRDRAKSLIALLKKENPVVKKEEDERTARLNYKFSPADEHFLVLLVPKGSVDLNELKFEIINFNTDQYPQKEFNVTVEKKDPLKGYDILIVRPLGNMKEAKKYEVAFNASSALLKILSQYGIHAFLFTKQNYEEFLRNKSVDAYRIFYKKHYLK